MKRPRVSVMYIVKDEEEYFPFSLRSIYDIADEIIVVDVGSKDRTPEIARSFAKVKLLTSDSPDFSVNRNLALKEAAGEWLIPMDADFVYYNDVNEVVPRLIQDYTVDVYISWFYHLMRDYFHVQNTADKDPLYCWKFLVRNVPGLRWVNPVHEQLVGYGPKIVDSNLFCVHYGYAKPQREVFKRWVRYAELEGRPGAYDGVNPDTILDDRPVRPFMREHPEVIRDYIAAKTGRRGTAGSD
ncbi:MAG TPA: glycosyltransferase [Firmicutes bacterium]|nr:glycosyltransferase [Bacillota bacterium]